MDLDFLLNQVKGAIFRDPTTPHREGHDPSGLIGQIEQLFGQFGSVSGRSSNVRPASEDALGDPADQQFGNVRPASEDPLGDPADEEARTRFRMR